MKKSRKLLIVLGAMVASTAIPFSQNDVFANEFEGKEDYWTQTCSIYTTNQNTINKCNEYKDYLNKKKNDKLNESADIQNKLNEVQGDLNKLGELAYSYQTQLEGIDAEIATLTTSITQMEASIGEVEAKIADQQALIDARKQSIKDRMLDIQKSVSTNEYIDFMMGSENLVDFIQRSESISTITEYDNKQMELLDAEVKKLEADEKELVRIRDTMKAQQGVLDQKRAEVAVVKQQSDSALAALNQQKEAMKTQQTAATAEARELAAAMPTMAAPVEDNGGGSSGGGSGQLNWGRNFYSMYYSSPYNVISNVNLTGQCTWYVFGRASEVNGTYLQNKIPRGNANAWYGEAAARGLAVGQTPRTNGVIVWGWGQFGHVAFIESYENGMITISEGNVNAPGGGLDYGTSLETAIRYTRTSTLSYSSLVAQRGAPIGFIYF